MLLPDIAELLPAAEGGDAAAYKGIAASSSALTLLQVRI